MARRQLKTDDEAGFLMAFHDDIRETEQLFGVEVGVSVRLTKTRGLIEIRASAWKADPVRGDRCVAVFETRYPTASANRLHAGLYRAAIGIGAACYRNGLREVESKDSPGTDGAGKD